MNNLQRQSQNSSPKTRNEWRRKAPPLISGFDYSYKISLALAIKICTESEYKCYDQEPVKNQTFETKRITEQ
jgi:hypothetical protein